MAICGIPTTSLNAINKQHIVSAGMGIAAILNILLNLILIPKYSIAGAAGATIIVCVFEFFYEFYFMNRVAVKIRLMNGDSVKIVLASFMMGLFIIYSKENIFYTVIISTFVYTAFIIILKVFSLNDLIVIKKIIYRGE